MLTSSNKKSKLVEAIHHHEPIETIENILKTSSKEIDLVDNTSQLTPIQKAALEGRVDVLLRLADAGAYVNSAIPFVTDIEKDDKSAMKSPKECHKPPLLLAIENGHWMVSQLLLCLGANKNQALRLATSMNRPDIVKVIEELVVDIDIFRGVLYASTIQYPNLTRLLQPQINAAEDKQYSKTKSDTKIDFSAKKDLPEKSDIIITIRDEEPKEQITLKKVEQDLFGLIELAAQQKLPQKTQSLVSLNAGQFRISDTIPTFGHWGSSQNVMPLCSLFNDEKLQGVETRNSSMKLTPTQKKLYSIIKHGTHNHNTHNDNSDYLAILEHAFEQRDYVSVESLSNILGEGKILEYAFNKQNRELFFMIMFSCDKYTYELAHIFANKLQQFYNLVGPNFENQGILYRIISSGIHDLFPNYNSQKYVMLRNYLKHAQINENQFIAIYFKRVYRVNTINSVETAILWLRQNNLLTAQITQAIISHGKRFNINLNDKLAPEKKPSTRGWGDVLCKGYGPSKQIISFLDSKDKENLSYVSKSSRELCVSTQLLMIQHFLHLLESNINQQPWHRYWNLSHLTAPDVCTLMFLGAGVLLVAPSAALFKIGSDDQALLATHLAQALYNNGTNSCTDFQVNPCVKNAPKECGEFCSDYDAGQSYLAGSIISVIFSGLFLITGIIAGNVHAENTFGKLRRSFTSDHRFGDKKLADISPFFQQQGNRLFSELKSIPEFKLTGNSTIRQIKQELEEIAKQMESQNSSRAFKRD